jgi:superfamily II DNA/RNA helicase
MFSATFDPRIENLTYALLTNPLRIQIGSSHNADIKQNIIVVPTKDKFDWLAKFFKTKHERVLVFCNARVACDELARKLNDKGTTAMSMHGELTQEERGDILDAFRSGVVSVLVATDIASRGLDVPELNYVVNYDIAKDVESHVHRIGRTGRAGLKGEAFTIVGMDETCAAPIVVRALESSNQTVPVDLLHVAMKNPNFQATRKNVLQTSGFNFIRASSEAKKPVEGLSPMMRGFVKPKNEDTILKPERKSFTVIPAKNPQPLPEVKPKFEIIQPKKIEIVQPINPQVVPDAQAPNPAPYMQTNAPPMAGYQQNLIYQQYRDYLSRKESEK